MTKDSILVVLCLCTSLFRKLYKEGKHTLVATQAWVALDYANNNSLTAMISL